MRAPQGDVEDRDIVLVVAVTDDGDGGVQRPVGPHGPVPRVHGRRHVVARRRELTQVDVVDAELRAIRISIKAPLFRGCSAEPF